MCFIIIIIIHPLFLWRCVLFFLFFYSTPPPPLTTSGGRTSFTRPEVGFSGLPDGWQNVEYARPPFFFLFLLHYRLLLLVAVVPVRVFVCVREERQNGEISVMRGGGRGQVAVVFLGTDVCRQRVTAGGVLEGGEWTM
jgi:hypothetical protein